MNIFFETTFDDQELIDKFKDFFSDVKIIKKESYSGIENIIILAVPVASLSIQLIDFVWTYFSNKKNSNRKIIINSTFPADICKQRLYKLGL